jgi:WD40 repeat protein
MNYFSSQGQYIVAGSDDGSFFIWDRHTTNIMRVLRGDDSIVNCLQPHPSYCLLATSGIDPVVRLWSPRPEVMMTHIHPLSSDCIGKKVYFSGRPEKLARKDMRMLT